MLLSKILRYLQGQGQGSSFCHNLTLEESHNTLLLKLNDIKPYQH